MAITLLLVPLAILVPVSLLRTPVTPLRTRRVRPTRLVTLFPTTATILKHPDKNSVWFSKLNVPSHQFRSIRVLIGLTALPWTIVLNRRTTRRTNGLLRTDLLVLCRWPIWCCDVVRVGALRLGPTSLTSRASACLRNRPNVLPKCCRRAVPNNVSRVGLRRSN